MRRRIARRNDSLRNGRKPSPGAAGGRGGAGAWAGGYGYGWAGGYGYAWAGGYGGACGYGYGGACGCGGACGGAACQAPRKMTPARH